MSITYTVVTVLAALWVGFSAASIFFRAKWVVEPLSEYGVSRSWWPWLGTAKAAGAPVCWSACSCRSSVCWPRSAWCCTSPER
jgi:hypothetical protein